ncbi:hypothetical protein HPB48_004582 [Haemaphysalis longicornis]|uniref:Uncharacterized protein n=1 Tax=Haemaphysalis longicornis TaxID=44386 RepID=A0A9J6FEW5_HAELO|nr:hypothetical protein HPB48_004582 [Haemaphysalis longicornis]
MKLREVNPHVGATETCRTTSEYNGVSFQKILDIKSKAMATGREADNTFAEKARKREPPTPHCEL